MDISELFYKGGSTKPHICFYKAKGEVDSDVNPCTAILVAQSRFCHSQHKDHQLFLSVPHQSQGALSCGIFDLGILQVV